MITAITKRKIKILPTSEKKAPLHDLYDSNPYTAIQHGKIMARTWAKSLEEKDHVALAQTFIYIVIESYWQAIQEEEGYRSLPYFFEKFTLKSLDDSVLAVADAIGVAAAKLSVVEASYQLGNVYTALLPETTRSGAGVFYTPPSLTKRLMAIAEEAGIDWSTAKVIDPACGGGAFLAPVCQKMIAAIRDQPAEEILQHVEKHLIGWEIDPFGGWLTQVFVEVVLNDYIRQTGIRPRSLVKICDSLQTSNIEEPDRFDLVIGNPPYGKLKLSDTIRKKYNESLYGHPNYYGLFTHLALNLAKQGGTIAFLTPTSFLSGEYFKNLRVLIRKQAATLEIDFVSFRKGVFEDVLQETMLAVYRKEQCKLDLVKVNQITTTPERELNITTTGRFPLPEEKTAPWILPRTPAQSAPVLSMQRMRTYLQDWGYKVSTGPLVWNRHKKQLSAKKNKNKRVYPIVWAEAITTDGQFIMKAEKKNHTPYFTFKAGDEWLITKKSCILLQRTTAKEQDKRLIAAALPTILVGPRKGVIIENHLNMIIPVVNTPLVIPAVLAAFLNSRATNEAFRAISGSVAVSAYELESFPLPEPLQLTELTRLIAENSAQEAIEMACRKLYSLTND